MPWVFLSSRFGVFFLLLLCRPPGSWHFVILVPTNYTALQGQLVIHIHFPEEEETTTTRQFWRDDQNSSSEAVTSSWTEINDTNSLKKDSERESSQKNQINEVSSTLPSPLQPYFLSLFASHNKKPLRRYKVPGDGSQTGFVFPCGVVVHGGQHVVRLKRNKTVVAESPLFNVSWPKVVIDVPSRLETYRSPADIKFRFIQSKCLPINPKFRTWAELLFHGPEMADPSTSSSMSLTNFPDLSALKISGKKVDDESVVENFDINNRERFTDLSISKVNKLLHRVNAINSVKFNKAKKSDSREFISDIKSEVERDFDSRNKISFFTNFSNRNLSTSRPKRMFTLTSLEGSTIPSKSNSNIRPEALKRWPWEVLSLGDQIAQRVPVQGSLYSQAVHDIRFSCEVVGPAGLYSVRVISDIPSNPIIAQSAKFPVEWAEEFTLSVPRSSIVPCLSAVPVTYTHPMCVGSQDKIRLYARVRANVTSANPPMHLRYVMEKRAVNKTTSFDCSFFTDEPSEFCFVYVNRATSGAVSNVQRQCVPTFKPNVLRMDGDWGEWSPWTDCSSSCGLGVRARHRLCDSPSPRNGGLFCQGSSIATSPCGDPTCLPPLQMPISSMVPPLGDNHECQCGCHVLLKKDLNSLISTSAEECSGQATWIYEGPTGTIIAAELSRAALLPGFQWLKIRDGNSTSSPLLLALPSSKVNATHHLERVPARLTSTTPILLIAFRSDVNSSFVGSVWGFRMKIRAMTPLPPEVVLAVLGTPAKREIAPVHIVIMVLVATILVATAAYGVYYCRQYRVVTESLLVVDDSPLETPDGSPFHERRKPIVTTTGSASTLTEVLSLKSLKFGVRKGPSHASSYTRLARNEDFKKGVLRSLPSSPRVTSMGFLAMRRSSSQLTRILRRGNTYQKQKNRRSASFDQLRTSCVSPIIEDKTLPNSFTMEDITKKSKKETYIEMEAKLEEEGDPERGEDNSSKYKEHRKSLLATRNIVEKLKQAELEPTKLSKERLNRERASLERLRRDTENTMKTASSASEISVSGTEYEYDYYDYDVGNASAVPGSLFGMDPTLVPWMIDIDELDIKSADQLSSPKGGTTPTEEEDSSRRFCLVTPPLPTSKKNRPEEILLQQLNIVPVTDLLQQSSTSNESNENNDTDNDRTPTADTPSPPHSGSSLLNETKTGDAPEEETGKILNIHDMDDFQFADESEDEEE